MHEILKILLHIITMLICVLNGKVFHIITELLKQIMFFFVFGQMTQHILD